MILEVLLCCTAACTLILLWQWLSRTRSKLPPGPFRFPLLGNLPQIVFYTLFSPRRVPFYVALRMISKLYGPVVFLQMGQRISFVIVNDEKLIREVLDSEAWAERLPKHYVAERSWGHSYGLLIGSGEEWREIRRFTIRTLRDFGFGKTTTQESAMAQELQEIFTKVDATIQEGQGSGLMRMNEFFSPHVLNILWLMVSGSRFSSEDQRLHNMLEATKKQLQLLFSNQRSPWAFFIQLLKSGSSFKSSTQDFHDYFRQLLRERRAEGGWQDDPKDFIALFLQEIEVRSGTEPNYYTDEQLIALLVDLFMVGSDTTANLLEFAMIYMIKHPEVQATVQEEIDSVIGPDKERRPTAEDRIRMPYTEATALECMRHANIVPVPPRHCSESTTLGGYDIPKGTIAFPNVHGFHLHSTEAWVDPAGFNPTRFLDPNTHALVDNIKILPFGGGKRVCIGEKMARLTFFTFFAGLLQRYHFSSVPGTLPPSTKPAMGVILRPQEFSVQVARR